jgi:hypothetical protein
VRAENIFGVRRSDKLPLTDEDPVTIHPNISTSSPYARWIVEIKLHLIKMVQNQSLKLDERLIMMALFINEFDRPQAEPKPDEYLYKLMVRYEHFLSDPQAFNAIVAAIEPNYQYQFDMIRSIIEMRVHHSLLPPKQKNMIMDSYKSYGLTDEYEPKAALDKYILNLEKSLQPTWAHATKATYKNYLSNFIFGHVNATENTLLELYLKLAINFACIRFFINAFSGDGVPDRDYLVNVLVQYSKLIDHDPAFINKLMATMSEKKLNNIAATVPLLRV